jgi:hypothetical protein
LKEDPYLRWKLQAERRRVFEVGATDLKKASILGGSYILKGGGYLRGQAAG